MKLILRILFQFISLFYKMIIYNLNYKLKNYKKIKI